MGRLVEQLNTTDRPDPWSVAVAQEQHLLMALQWSPHGRMTQPGCPQHQAGPWSGE